MKLFGGSSNDDAYGAIVDIGSGSVLVAIVHSSVHSPHPHIVWSHREHAPLKNIDSLEQSAKAVMTALVNASMLLDAHGREALRSFAAAAKLTHMQCGIGAPWSYTVTKTLNYEQEKPFVISDDLIDELTRSIQDKISSELQANESLQQLGLTVVNRVPMDLLANGYRVDDPIGETANELKLSYSNTISQKHLMDAITEMHDKLLTQTTLSISSFALIFHTVMEDLFPNKYDLCLIDVTYEATEISIVRDGVLKYCTHTPFGLYSIVREISAITEVPLAEAYGYLQSNNASEFLKTLPTSQASEVETVFEKYTEKLTALLHETGDDLSIPKHIAIHTEKKMEKLFVEILTNATKRAVKSNPHIEAVTDKILQEMNTETEQKANQKTPKDSALLLSAQFFHITCRG